MTRAIDFNIDFNGITLLFGLTDHAKNNYNSNDPSLFLIFELMYKFVKFNFLLDNIRIQSELDL